MKTIKALVASFLMLAFLTPLQVFAAEKVEKEGMMQEVKQEVKEVAHDISQNVSDTAITTKIKASYAIEPNIRSMQISVSTKDGVVNIAGKVGAGLQKDRLVEIARSVKGVIGVNSSAVEVADSESYFKDAMITAKSKIKVIQLSSDDKIASGYKVHVETTNGNVYLYGTVANKDDVKTIEKSIKQVPGVDTIYNSLKVKSKDA